MRDYQIAPSILAADFARLGADVEAVLAAGVVVVAVVAKRRRRRRKKKKKKE